MQWPPAPRVSHTRDPQEQLQQQQVLVLLLSFQDHSQQGTAHECHTPYCRQLRPGELGAIPNHRHYSPVLRAGRTSTSVPPWRDLSTKYICVGSLTNYKLWLKFYLPVSYMALHNKASKFLQRHFHGQGDTSLTEAAVLLLFRFVLFLNKSLRQRREGETCLHLKISNKHVKLDKASPA